MNFTHQDVIEGEATWFIVLSHVVLSYCTLGPMYFIRYKSGTKANCYFSATFLCGKVVDAHMYCMYLTRTMDGVRAVGPNCG